MFIFLFWNTVRLFPRPMPVNYRPQFNRHNFHHANNPKTDKHSRNAAKNRSANPRSNAVRSKNHSTKRSTSNGGADYCQC